MRRGFTLIELLVSFGVATMLIGVFYFYHFGVLFTVTKAQEKEDLNDYANTTLERMVRELRMAEQVLEVLPQEIKFRKYRVGPTAEEEASSYTGERPVYETITYRLRKLEKGYRMERQLDFAKPVKMFDVEECDEGVFNPYVLEEPGKDTDPVPRFHAFDFSQQIGSELQRIVYVTIDLKMKQVRDSLEIRTAVSMPAVHARLMQPTWNTE